jgi:hypothetical protein
MHNELFFSDSEYLIGKTADREKIRKIYRSRRGSSWVLIGKGWAKGIAHTDRNAQYIYRIPIDERRKAERLFGVKAKKVG